jgi:hypothetical protein
MCLDRFPELALATAPPMGAPTRRKAIPLREAFRSGDRCRAQAADRAGDCRTPMRPARLIALVTMPSSLRLDASARPRRSTRRHRGRLHPVHAGAPAAAHARLTRWASAYGQGWSTRQGAPLGPHRRPMRALPGARHCSTGGRGEPQGPLAQGGEDVDENTENLCTPCHLEATAEQFGHAEPIRGRGVGRDGRPTSGDHPWNHASR